jgi:2-dehydropantoate 2-reductase
MNICILGIGGVGGYFGGKIARFLEKSKSQHQIFFVARGEHLEVIRKNGLQLDTKEDGEIICKPFLATDDILELPIIDICLVCVKVYDLKSVMEKLKDRIHSETVILPLLNGVDIYKRIRDFITEGVVLPACVYVGTHIERPGKVTQRGGGCKVQYGPDPRNVNHDLSILKSLLTDSGISSEWYPEPYTEIWTKFMFIAAFGLVSASKDVTLGQILESESFSQLTRSIMEEVYNLAKASGIKLKDDTIQSSFDKAKGFPYVTKTSFQRDFETPGKKDERDLFGGTIIRMGKNLEIKTESTEVIYKIMNEKKPAFWIV